MRTEMADEEAQVAWLTRQIRAFVRKRPKRRQLTDAAAHAQALYETNAARLPAAGLACAAGCSSCCIAQVGVEMAEAFAILEHLRAERSDLLDRAACEAAAESGDADRPIPADAERMGRSRLVRQALARVMAALIGEDGAIEHAELHTAVTAARQAGEALAWQRARVTSV